MYKISIIIPVYNASLYLRECLNSIISQEFSDFEIILVNDGSTDDSLSICYEYALKYKHIQVLSGENLGVSSARNKGLDIATGKWLVFVDADDKLLPNALNTLYNTALTTKADLVLANAVRFENNKTSKPFIKIKNNTFSDAICHIKHFALWGYLIPNDVVRKNNIRFIDRLAYSEDRVFIYQMAKYCQTITYIETPIYIYRINPTSACQNKNGLRNAQHQFRAASHLFNIAIKYKKDNSEIFKLIYNEGKHVIDMGIYQFLEHKPDIKSARELWYEYKKLFGMSFNSLNRLILYIVKNYLTIQRRKIIIFKR